MDHSPTVVQANAATAEVLAAANQDLSGQAKLLSDHVPKFKIEHNDATLSYVEDPALKNNLLESGEISGMSLSGRNSDYPGTGKY